MTKIIQPHRPTLRLVADSYCCAYDSVHSTGLRQQSSQAQTVSVQQSWQHRANHSNGSHLAQEYQPYVLHSVPPLANHPQSHRASTQPDQLRIAEPNHFCDRNFRPTSSGLDTDDALLYFTSSLPSPRKKFIAMPPRLVLRVPVGLYKRSSAVEFSLLAAAVLSTRRLGADGQHVKLALRDKNGKVLQVLAFNAPEEFFREPGDEVAAWFQPTINEWQGARTVEGRLLHIE